MPENLLSTTVLFMGGPLLAIVIINLFRWRTAQKFCFGLGMIVALLQMAAAGICMAAILGSHKDFIEFSLFWDYRFVEGASRFSVDLLSLVVLFCIGMVSFIALLTGWKTIGLKKVSFCSLVMVAMLGMNGIATVTDMFSLYVYLEITGIASVVLIALYRDSRRLEGAFKYLAMSAIASAFLLAGLAVIFLEVGSLQFAEVAATLLDWKHTSQPMLLMLAFVFFMAAVSVKAGLMPFHGWLPDAYQSAPAAVSVLLAGIVTKAGGVYVIIRTLYSVFVAVDSINIIFGLLGLLSIFYGSLAALQQNGLKRLLAYSSISQIGYIVLGASTGTFLGVLGAALHFFNHATFKTTLFVTSMALEEQVGNTKLDHLGGLQARMPVTGASSILAFLSAAGIPPLAGFWSKLIIIIAVWQHGHAVSAGLALVASIFTAAYFLRVQRKIFFGKLPEPLSDVKEIKGPIRWAELLLSAVTVGGGLAFPALLLFLQTQGLL